ncbi:oxidoreductase [Morganella psychrotolerans]|uniref:Oxidoreductase n=1 Tax=Morganella psychrotolerans TaxID=368603 RepID=A0A5M9QZ07_9GAMM|nr:MDR family oxidoreductase [Morganella psychrotolerans]KAA8713610.1 oxidoreductase [Morganella psychrotolerans]OBU06468.1 alcohol dehydrogenase [Morganella psychrotolerans]
MFNCILIENTDGYTAKMAQMDESQLPEHNVTVQIDYSTLNYKDGLAITGKGPVVRSFPMIPGIDFAGTVTESSSEHYKVGDKVILNGWSVGEKYWGGLSQVAKVKDTWLTRLPAGLTTKQAMMIGTAGYTAMLAVHALLKQGITKESGKVLVTGASGGVGSFAVSLLAKLGFDVIASTGRTLDTAYLIDTLGAKEIMDRSELSAPGKPLTKERWAAAIDCVGSHTLAGVCAGTQYGGVVAACGLAQGMDFNGTVAPFILRGVSLIGIDSVMCPHVVRQAAWDRLAELADMSVLAEISHVISLEEAIPAAQRLLDGKIRGRVVVDVNN